MNKKLVIISIISIIFLIVIIVWFIGFSNQATDEAEIKKEKIISEIQYLDSEYVNLLNTLNNIKFENYDISISEIKEESNSEDSSSSSSAGGSSGGGESGESTGETSGGSKESQSGGGQNQENQQQGGTSEDSGKQYSLNPNTVFTTTSEQINWDYIKERVELLYSSFTTITLDLYDSNLNKDDILNLNADLDQLTLAVKEENKEKTAESLVKLHSYLPNFAKNISTDTSYPTVMETKSNVLYAYRFVDSGNWQEVSNYTSKAIEIYQSLLNNIPSNEKQYSINKVYVALNELENAANLQDREIYLIKYKNLIEELQTI